jgi:hypothetical protein
VLCVVRGYVNKADDYLAGLSGTGEGDCNRQVQVDAKCVAAAKLLTLCSTLMIPHSTVTNTPPVMRHKSYTPTCHKSDLLIII